MSDKAPTATRRTPVDPRMIIRSSILCRTFLPIFLYNVFSKNVIELHYLFFSFPVARGTTTQMYRNVVVVVVCAKSLYDSVTVCEVDI